MLTHAQRANSITYFIGFRVDTMRMRGNQLDIERQLTNFRSYDLVKFHPLVPGMDILPRSFSVKELPTICFEGIYEGGKVAAMKRRRKLIEADPKHKEEKHKKKLAKLKKRMEAMQRKKEEAKQADTASNEEEFANVAPNEEAEPEVDNYPDMRKRKREEESVTLADDENLKKEEKEEKKEKEEEEEAARLENALDAITGAGLARHKSREEAEIDRQKLLAGELLADGAEDADRIADRHAAAAASMDQRPARQLSREEREAEELRRAGLVIVSDDDAIVLGGMILPWRHGHLEAAASIKQEKSVKAGEGEPVAPENPAQSTQVRTAIRFKTQFDVIELDASGRAVDKGDDDFMPSLEWIGRKGGFEFKLGERGLGYYRTGKKVVVPSNVTYS